MFNLENTPCHLIQLDATSICIGCNRNRGNNSELLKLQLPKKLLLPPEEEGLCKENDFKVLSGTYTEASVYSMDKLKNENSNVITSEYGIKGLNIYNLSSSTGMFNSHDLFKIHKIYI